MEKSEYKHLSIVQLKKRLKIYKILSFVAPAMSLASIVGYFFTDYKYNWTWLLNGFVYLLLTIQFTGQMQRMKKEIEFREERARKKNLEVA